MAPWVSRQHAPPHYESPSTRGCATQEAPESASAWRLDLEISWRAFCIAQPRVEGFLERGAPDVSREELLDQRNVRLFQPLFDRLLLHGLLLPLLLSFLPGTLVAPVVDSLGI